MKVAFHVEQLDLRGSSVVVREYATYNETLLSNQSYIICNGRSDHLESLPMIKERFPVFLYDRFEQAASFVKDNSIDVVYYLKAGVNDGKILPGVKNVIHAVFWFYQPHGEVYAYVSKWLAQAASGGRCSFVPHIIAMETEGRGDYREFLKIPKDALVLGYGGGNDAFAIPFVQEAVREIAQARKDIYFFFINIDPFAPPTSNIIHVGGTSDMDIKAAFINTCDACLHARIGGETFGLTIGEFSVNNKPTLTYSGHDHRAHIDMLGDKAILYSDKANLIDIITHMDRNELAKGDWNAYAWYTPENVMNKFSEVFLQ
jgi:hypothetical protein